MNTPEALYKYLLRLADDRLILGHRTSEWCGHGPILEEDIALSNLALDHIGQANHLYEYAAEFKNDEKDADDLAFFRDARQFYNIQMMELPNHDFGFTIAREFLYSAFNVPYLSRLRDSDNDQLNGLASKFLKESRYHLRHSREWMLRLGDGTEESQQRIQSSINELWPYTEELFYSDEVERLLIDEMVSPDPEDIRSEWNETINNTLQEATLTRPEDDQHMKTGGRDGYHTEHLGYLLAEMQRLPRAYPEAEW